MSVTSAKPVIRWAGGKTRLLPELLARTPYNFGLYYEPFCGGAALFFALEPSSTLNAVLNDANPDLTRCYRAVASDVEGVIVELAGLAQEHGATNYKLVRDAWNDDSFPWTDVERAAAFIYLNKACFNGLWRVNRSGKFNVPMGDAAPDAICDPDGLRAAALALSRAVITCGDYREAVADAEAGDLVYFDPPYDRGPTSKFTSYTAGDFGPDQQRELAALAHELVARDVAVMASNADTPLVRELWSGFRLEVVGTSRSVGASGSSRGRVNELVMCGGFPDARVAPEGSLGVKQSQKQATQ